MRSQDISPSSLLYMGLSPSEAEIICDSFRLSGPHRSLVLKAMSLVLEFSAQENLKEADSTLSCSPLSRMGPESDQLMNM